MAGVTRVIGITRFVCVSSVASMSGVALRQRRVAGVRALIWHAVLGVVAHVITLPNIREYASSRPATSGDVRDSEREGHPGGRKPASVTVTSRRTEAFDRWVPAPVRAWTQ